MATGQKSRVPLGTPVAYLQYGAFAEYKVLYMVDCLDWSTSKLVKDFREKKLTRL